MSSALKELKQLAARVEMEKRYSASQKRKVMLDKKPEVEAAVAELKEENLKATVEWLSSFPNRYNRAPNPNAHVDALLKRLNDLMTQSGYTGQYLVEAIQHTSTRQKTARVRLVGAKRPDEIIVIGGHLDSINGWGGSDKRAPGADDNASGSANVLETLRVFVSKGVPERTVEFYWYAGEESGLLGSGEIAKQYKKENKDVVAVLQLDMTLYPGAGEFVIGNVTDYTSKWLQDYLVAINDTYVKARLIEDHCGYACSDHASWFRQGYPTMMPFEADTRQMNPKIHTDKDLIDVQSSFRHSLQFSQIALVFAMELGNSTARQPN